MKYFSLVVKQPTISPIQKCICFLNIDKKKDDRKRSKTSMFNHAFYLHKSFLMK